MTPPEAIDLAALRAIAEKATPGPWVVGSYGGMCCITDPEHRHGSGSCVYKVSDHYDNEHVVSLKATPGDPYPTKHGDPGCGIIGNYDYDCGGAFVGADATLIAAMRNALPALLDRLAAAEAVVEAVKQPTTATAWYRTLAERVAAYDRAIAGQQQRQEGT